MLDGLHNQAAIEIPLCSCKRLAVVVCLWSVFCARGHARWFFQAIAKLQPADCMQQRIIRVAVAVSHERGKLYFRIFLPLLRECVHGFAIGSVDYALP
jgi:hypothetical protein